ncbi:MAG: hypothetical protein IJM59_07790 [Proteobacteria bacterium]|nr:hypothetical protein [Pseudomonadota bacterium]
MGNTISTCKEGQVETNECIKQGNVVDCKNPKACGDCKNNDTECKENKLYTCDSAMWQTEPTAECHCNDKMTACQPCYKEGETQCSNNAQETCILIGDNLVWSAPKACKNGKTCINDKCAESNTDVPCTLNQKQCTSETEFKTCDENGHWGEPVSCDSGKKCVDGECVDSKECEKGKCIDKTQYKECNNGQWGEATVCPHGCDINNNRCYDCDPSKTVVCDNKNKINELVKCNSGTLGATVQTCQNCIVNKSGEDDYCNDCVLEGPICESGNVCACQDNKKVCEKNLCIQNRFLSCKENQPNDVLCTSKNQTDCPEQKCDCTNGKISCENKDIIFLSKTITTGMHYRCDDRMWKELGFCLSIDKDKDKDKVSIKASKCTENPSENKNCVCDVVCKRSNRPATYHFLKCGNDGLTNNDVKASFSENEFRNKLNNFFGFIPGVNNNSLEIEEFIGNIMTCDEMKNSFIIDSNIDNN